MLHGPLVEHQQSRRGIAGGAAGGRRRSHPGATARADPRRAGDLPDFRKAESLYVKSAGFRTGQFDLGYSYYTRGVRGYRLAHSSGINADVQTGYRDAADNAKKADKAWKEAKDEYAQKGTEEGVKACDEMLGYAKSLLDHVNAETAPSKDK